MAYKNVTKTFKSQSLWQQLIIVLLFNTLIAVFLHFILPNSIFFNQLLLSQSIGLSVLFSYHIFGLFIELQSWRVLIPLLIGTPIGIVIAIMIQAIVLDASLEFVMQAVNKNYANILSSLLIGLFFGAIIVAFFIYRERIHEEKIRLQTEKINNLNHHKTIAKTELRLLQAQIEPHFLFNSLSNVISLIEKDPKKSKFLLESLTEFLRASLKRSTDMQQALENEIELIRHYLEIMKIRIGNRLEYDILILDDIKDCAFPPLLLQPLVENAVIHGIEPLTEGGRIDVTISKSNTRLIITVSDTGKGLSTETSKGFGLSNIRDRIQSLYRNQGSLIIEENSPSGVTARIEIPYEPM